jgi:hypothetical protein
LEENTISKEKMARLENLTLELIKAYCLGTQVKEKKTNASI